MNHERVGMLLSRDLIFISKVTGTARELGATVHVAGNQALATALLAEHHPRAVFVDLSAGDLVRIEALIALKALAGGSTPFIAFGSHVDTAALDSARAAGCSTVLPRSRFTVELPALIERFLGPIDKNSQDASTIE
ncbi:MAG: response regulator [Isosphaeraceae bacterium]|nr:response regulator [Isosphaeraceae bacterium]